MASLERLYTPELLAATLRLAKFPFDPSLPRTGEARSKSCGSIVRLGLALDPEGGIARRGLTVQACAVGQAAAAVFAEGAAGASAGEIGSALDAIERWLAGEGPLPAWPGFALLAGVDAYPGRHGALKLPWQAALAALSSGEASG